MKIYYTSSDMGSVLVGTKNFGILLTNGIGDGKTTCIVLEKEEENKKPSYAKFNTCIKGSFNIYQYDCSDRKEEDIVTTLHGNYFVYYHEYIVYFIKY